MIRAALFTLVIALAGAPAARAEITVVPVTSPGGIEAWLYEEHTVPIITIYASFLGGPMLDPEGQEGTTELMAALLNEGAGNLDSWAYSTALEELAAQVTISTGSDDLWFFATMLTETRDAVTDLVRLALVEPRFDGEAVERLRAQTLTAIEQNHVDPHARAGDAFYAQAFPGHPYGRPKLGTGASVTQVSVEGLRAAHQAAVTREHLRVAVAGDVTPAELGRILDRLFGDLPAKGPALPPVVAPVLSGTTTILDFDTPQSVVVVGNAGIARDDPDYIPVMLLDYVLGGGSLSTRLGEEMRTERGLTYGVYTYPAAGHFGALYMGTFSSSNERVAEAIRILRQEWARMAEHGVTETELAGAKRYLTGEYPLRFYGTANIAAQLLGLQLAGHEPSYINRRSALIDAVTIDDIARVARRLLVPDDLTIVVAGRPEGLEPAN